MTWSFLKQRDRRQAPEERERGDATIELALVIFFFFPVAVLGTADVASVSYAAIEVTSAAHAGALYGMRSTTYASSTTGITLAAQGEATDFGTNLNVSPTIFYACSNSITGTQYSTQSAATTGCTGAGNQALEFLKVTTTATLNAPFKIPGLATSYPLTGVAIQEVAE